MTSSRRATNADALDQLARDSAARERADDREVDDAIADGRIKITCSTCGWAIGFYQPGRVAVPSRRAPRIWLKCMRRACRTASLVVITEIVE